MSDVIDLLERMGQDAQWSQASPEAIDLALTHGEIDPEFQSAILANDQRALEMLMGLSPLCAMLDPGKEEEEEEQDPEEIPSHENEEVAGQSALLLATSVA